MYSNIKGIVLRSAISGEADKLITVYTLESGKLSMVVPGAMKIKAKLAGAAELLTESEFIIYAVNQRIRPKVTGARIKDSFQGLKTDWKRFSMGQYCAQLTEKLTPFAAENDKKYELLARTLKLLETVKNPQRILLSFILRFLKLSGYSFTEFIDREKPFMDPEKARAVNRLATAPGLEVDQSLDISPQFETELRKHLEKYLSNYLTYKLSAQKFLEKVKLFNDDHRPLTMDHRIRKGL
jgi:DNA repair protein RecO (recombination protein O)